MSPRADMLAEVLHGLDEARRDDGIERPRHVAFGLGAVIERLSAATQVDRDVRDYLERLGEPGAERDWLIEQIAFLGHTPKSVQVALDNAERAGRTLIGEGEAETIVVRPSRGLLIAARCRAEVRRRQVRGAA